MLRASALTVYLGLVQIKKDFHANRVQFTSGCAKTFALSTKSNWSNEIFMWY